MDPGRAPIGRPIANFCRRLTMPAPSKTGSHKTFVDDDTYGEEAAPLGRQISEPALPPAQEEESDSGSEVEEIATASTRQAARAQTAAEHKRKEQ